MRASRTKVAALTLTGLIAASLTACAGGTAPSGPVELTMALWSSNEGHLALLQQIGDAFVAEHPDEVSSISFEPVTNPDYIAGLTTQVAGGNVPDLAWIPESSALEFVNEGILHDVKSTLESTSGYDLNDILPAAIGGWEGDDGAIYAYPFSNSPFGLYVNNDLLAKAGQSDIASIVGTDAYTWQTVADLGAAVHTAVGAEGLTVPQFTPTNWSALTMLGTSWGAEPWSADGKTCELNSPEMVEYLKWYQDQVARGAMPEVTGSIASPAFAGGNVTFAVAQLSTSGALDDSLDWTFLPLPAGPAGYAPIIGQAGVSVLERSANPQQASDFLAYLTNPENAALLAQFFPPPRESLLNVETLQKAAPKLSAEEIQSVIIDVVPDATVKAANPVLSQFTDKVRAGLDPIWTGGDVTEAVTATCESISPIIEG
ncbi:extracellular solute-binding protein [Glaciihabitans sp. UYNi722]|uniref:ABC transporter substrate-binding protein n=1 Tax=Glaciihabitans sp. UYNi722 TaxID=3156344 RepID=UPI003394B1A1